MRDARLSRLAEVLVGYCVGVQPGQLVRLSGPSVAEPLIVELYRQVVAAGGHPFVQMTPDVLEEIFFKTANDEQLGYLNPIRKFIAETIDCSIGIWGAENTKALTHCDPARMAAASSANRPIMTRFMERSADGRLKWVGVQFPCSAAAQDAEMSLQEYEEFVFNACLLNQPDPVAAWQAVSERQQRLVDFLSGKTDYHVVAANGTDVRMSLAGKKWINCNGHMNFPDGEVFTGPVLESVNGTICFSFPAVHGGREVNDVKLTFWDGKVIRAEASKGKEFLLSMLDMDKGSRFLGECAIGCNYSITNYTKNTLFDEKIGGTVHFALGAGYPETGNSNESGLHWDMVVDLRPGGFIEIDGEKFSENGKFLQEGFPC
jgi:aminopeptidase